MLTWLIPSIWNYKEVSELPNFQQSVNQTLSTAGVLAGLSGIPQRKAAEKAEVEKLNKEEKVLKAQIAQIEAGLSNDNSLNPQIEEDITKKSLELAKRKFELNPSEETYKEYARQLPGKPVPEDPEIIHQEEMEGIPDLARRNAEYDYAYQQAYGKEMSNLAAQQQSMDRMSRQQEAKKTQRRNFMSYLAKQSTSLDGPVGDLPMSIQKQIASQYSKSQRKTMMDRMDKEAKNGKQ